METNGAELTELIFTRVLPIGLAVGLAVFLTLALLAAVYQRARAGRNFHLYVMEEIEHMKKEKKEGKEVHGLKSWIEVEKLVRKILEEQKILPPGKSGS